VNTEGRYRIHAVAELTGVPEGTLRAWERRYAVPTPVRSASGYRLYSAEDVDRVRQMRDLCAKGMAPVDASKLVREPRFSAPESPEHDSESPLSMAVTRLVASARRMRPDLIEQEVQRALMLADASTVAERVFCPALAQIGSDWEHGIIDVAQEHMASEILSTAVRQLVRLVGPPRPSGEVLLACFADEEHALPLYAAAFRFVEWGVRPHILGPRTPPSAVAAAIGMLSPALVGLSVTVPPETPRARELIRAYADAVGNVPWLVGGAASQALRVELEAAGAIVAKPGREESHHQIGELLETRR
jgi:DNA-binding transcriptional MerR regulator